MINLAFDNSLDHDSDFRIDAACLVLSYCSEARHNSLIIRFNAVFPCIVTALVGFKIVVGNALFNRSLHPPLVSVELVGFVILL